MRIAKLTLLPLLAAVAVASPAAADCTCTGGIDYRGHTIDPAATSCGMRICGSDGQTYECREPDTLHAGGWVGLDDTSCAEAWPDPCSCTAGFDYLFVPIDPAETSCGMQVCGRDDQFYECRPTTASTPIGWVALGGGPCPWGRPPDPEPDPGPLDCVCHSIEDYLYWPTGFNTGYCGMQVCGVDDQLHECGEGGWSVVGGSCEDDYEGEDVSCTSGRVDYLGTSITTLLGGPPYHGAHYCDSDGRVYECVVSGWEPRAGSAEDPCWGRDLDRDGLVDSFENELLERFAPIVHLHPDDDFRPSSVDFYLPQVRMRYHRGWFQQDHQALDYGQVTAANIATQSFDGVSSGRVPGTDTNWFLEALHESRGGQNPAVVPCYGHARKAPGEETGIDLQYWFFYPFNGDITGSGGVLGAEHEGDWEHVTIWVDDSGTTRLQTFMSRHANEGEWYEDYELEITGDQVHVYSAIDSHASYPAAGDGERSNLPDDHTAAGGPVWDCRTAGGGTLNMGELLHPFPGSEWLNYSGRWGDDLELEDTAHSPRGPAYQSRWWNDG